MTMFAGLGFGLESQQIHQLRRAVAHDAGQRHAVNVAGRRRFGHVHVAVGVEPDVADVFFLLAIELRDARRYACRDGVITAKHKRKKSFVQRFADGLGDVQARFSDFLEIFGAFFADRHFFGLFYFQIADVFDGVAQLLNCGLQAGASKRGGAHVDAAAALAEVHGNADDSHFLRHSSILSGKTSIRPIVQADGSLKAR